MAVYVTERDPKDLYVKVIEDKEKGELRLVYNNHAFVVCKTSERGNHVVQIVDADTGVRHEANIQTTCWQR